MPSICGLSLRMLKNTLIQAIYAAADEIKRFTDTDFKISNKEGINDLVTEVDHASEKAIIDFDKDFICAPFLFKSNIFKALKDFHPNLK